MDETRDTKGLTIEGKERMYWKGETNATEKRLERSRTRLGHRTVADVCVSGEAKAKARKEGKNIVDKREDIYIKDWLGTDSAPKRFLHRSNLGSSSETLLDRSIWNVNIHR
jgi:hypothetical protein